MQQKIDLGNAVLKGVSRSFYISIRLLPRLMREPVSVAYLLARASDTIADTEKVPMELRKACLQKFYDALKNEVARDELLEMISSKFVNYQTNKKEEMLLRRLEDVFGWYDTVREWAWDAINVVLKPIVEGQQWDVDYFGEDGPKQIDTEERLEKYCYQVAGSVGEFWGVVGTEAYHRFTDLEFEKLQSLGVKYGKGLQLVNILRDMPEDLEKGRCYIPDVDFKDKKALLRASKIYRRKARKYLEQGLIYASSLRQKRTKIATALPALIGLKTLELMDEADWEQWEQGIKITRKQVRQCMWKAFWH